MLQCVKYSVEAAFAKHKNNILANVGDDRADVSQVG